MTPPLLRQSWKWPPLNARDKAASFSGRSVGRSRLEGLIGGSRARIVRNTTASTTTMRPVEDQPRVPTSCLHNNLLIPRSSLLLLLLLLQGGAFLSSFLPPFNGAHSQMNTTTYRATFSSHDWRRHTSRGDLPLRIYSGCPQDPLRIPLLCML